MSWTIPLSYYEFKKHGLTRGDVEELRVRALRDEQLSASEALSLAECLLDMADKLDEDES